MAMEQLQGIFSPSFRAEAAPPIGGDKGRSRMVSTERSSTSSAHELDRSGSSSRKNKRRSNAGVVSGVKGKRASRGHGEDAKVGGGGGSSGHSVAERLRREKINEKMKMLQSLVPGCEKLAGKALLDEIISYVHSLQNQVEFLSMKLGTLNPAMLHELGLDIGSVYLPQVLKMTEVPPIEEPVQWMRQATAAASPAGATTVLSQDGSHVNVMQMQVRPQQEDDELSNCMSMGFFQHD